MLRIVLLASLLFIFVGCTSIRGTGPHTYPATYTTVIIDSCEYLNTDQGAATTRIYSLTHKGNCKNPIHLKECK
jgi:hypothetical protein